jgi:hypothetical protein
LLSLYSLILFPHLASYSLAFSLSLPIKKSLHYIYNVKIKFLYLFLDEIELVQRNKLRT